MKTGGCHTTNARLCLAKWCCLVLLAATLSCAAAAFGAPGTSQEASDGAPAQTTDIEAFMRKGCLHCARAEAFLAVLKHDQPDLVIVVRDVLKEPVALERLKQMAERQGVAAVSVPAFVVRGQMIVGFADEVTTGQLILNSLAQERSAGREPAKESRSCRAAESLSCEASPISPEADSETFAVNFFSRSISLHQVGLPLFTFTMGLLDGFNPCSMWVLILMISLLAPMNNRPRMFAVAGAFVAVQGIAYFSFMAAWLNFFLLVGVSRASEIIIAVIALLAGAVNLKDFWRLGWGVSLSIPASAKPGIYARLRHTVQAENLASAIAGAVILAILVQIVEFVCTSGFPAMFTRILTIQQLDTAGYYGYLLLYDLAYMLDDAFVLAIGIITLSQRRLQEKEGRLLKLISGFVMVGLGLYLLVGPN